MLQKNDTTLQSSRVGVDLMGVNHASRDPATDDRHASELSVRQLAHELNSLLDGSMRFLGLARRCLTTPDAERDDDTLSIEQALNKLQAAQQSLHHMADLLHQAMRSERPDHQLLIRDRPLGRQVQELLDTLRPKAQEHGVEIEAHVSPSAADLSVGPLATVLLNGLNNAIEACASTDRRPATVECSISVTAKRELLIVIADTGPGVSSEIASDLRPGRTTKSDGHGIGAALSREIVTELGGSFRLSNVPFGRGAVLQIQIPLSRLRAA